MIRRSVPVASGLLGLFVAIVVLEHALVTELTPKTHMLSEYANASGVAGPLMTVAFASWALSLALTGVAALALPGRGAGTVLGVLLLSAAVGMVGTAVAHTQTVGGELPPGERLRTGGHVHDLASGAVLWCFFPAVLASLIRMPRRRWFVTVATASLLVSAAVVPLFAALGVDADGLRQRIQLGCGCAWQLSLLLALRLAERSAPRAR